ncbi:sigma-70 family RNA polymerase sigma factor [Candidatus Methylobacter oryzae]|uniref:Sigma-70 family RNA polymerase sigma factor n=1 Tax=Candidatus Methylobacter oryzae TaxID=2497749 RepID=A0ABY3CA25_9GAMM|nr:RNA polymerase sigma factor RpoD/SigA [Candidatus Methylobacter oryzae]TRW94228.1 sigma-70 family RNA polymerase sigma factor [Candidatus Methylobacter oryzae]
MSLNKPLSRPEASIVNSANEAEESAEHWNFQMASNLEDGKARLIKVLSQFPATALWLFHKYETDSPKPEQAAEAMSAALAQVKHHYLLASLSFSGRGFNREAESDEKQRLTETLQAFPFSTEDLSMLTEFIIYAFTARDDCDQSANRNVKSHSDWISKRLEGSSRRYKLNLPDIIENMCSSQFDQQFLFLSGTDMRQYVTDMIFAERLWLNSRRALAEANSGLVSFIANQYKCGFLDFDDLVQEGQTGLLKAIDKFDHHLGFQFSTYAAYWIKQAISRALSRNERVVRVPCEQVANIHKVLRAKSELLSKMGREPSIKELSEYSKIPDDQINVILSISQTAISLENSDEDDDESLAPIDVLEQRVFANPFKKIEQSDLKAWIGKAINTLNPRELKVICCHFGVNTDNEMTLQEIGAELNLTRERVRQIQVKALNKMKLSYGKQLVSFL